MKNILSLSVGIVTLFLQTASAQLLESWENTLDGWMVEGPGYTSSFSTNTGVTDGYYSLALTGTTSPNYSVMLESPHTTELTALLANSTSIWFDVYAPAGSFGYYLQFSVEIWNPDIGYVSLDGYNFANIPAFGVETNLIVAIPADIQAELAASPNATALYFQIGGGYTAGNETFYLDNLSLNARWVGTIPTPYPPGTSPTNTFFAQSVSGVTLAESSGGAPPLYYQWQTDGGSGGDPTNIPDATNLIYVFNTTNVGTYQFVCVVSNSFGAVASPSTPVYVLPASVPILTTDISPYSTNVFGFIGGNVSFSANFGLGTKPITNQWLFSSTGSGYTPIVGAVNNSWIVTNVQTSSAGEYELTATNLIGGSNSTPAHLTALADPAAPGSTGVTNMYANCVMTNHPWAYWKFEETNDTFFQSMQAYDYSTHNFDATYGSSTDGSMATGCKDGGESLPDLGPGGSDKYAGFPANNMTAKMSANHANGYLLVPPLNLYTNTVTFTMWIKPFVATLPKSTGLFMNRNGGDAAGIGFGTTVNGSSTPCLAYTWNNNSAATYGWNSGLFPVSGIWNFVACTITPSNTVMYLYYVNGNTTNLFRAVNNGSANGSESFSGGTTWLGSDNFNNGLNFYGWIDEVAIFTNSLGEDRIQDLFLKSLGMTNGIPPVFQAQPTNATVFQGQTLQLSAYASGIPNPNYQWQFYNGSTWNNLATSLYTNGLPSRMTTNATFYWQNYTNPSTVLNYRAIAINNSGSATSSVPTVTYVPVANWNQGVWTVNFAVPSAANGGPDAPYIGLGVLATINTVGTTNSPSYAYYWNALRGGNMQNTTSLRDDGVTPSGVNFGSTNAYLGTYSSGQPMNNALLDQYCQIFDTNNGVNFFFTQVPKGKYNLALYGCVASYVNRGVGFTVITNGVSAGTQWVTNVAGRLLPAVRQHGYLYQPAGHERDVAGERKHCSSRPRVCRQSRGRLQRGAT